MGCYYTTPGLECRLLKAFGCPLHGVSRIELHFYTNLIIIGRPVYEILKDPQVDDFF